MSFIVYIFRRSAKRTGDGNIYCLTSQMKEIYKTNKEKSEGRLKEKSNTSPMSLFALHSRSLQLMSHSHVVITSLC